MTERPHIACKCGVDLPLPPAMDTRVVCVCGRAYRLEHDAGALLARIDAQEQEIAVLRARQ